MLTSLECAPADSELGVIFLIQLSNSYAFRCPSPGFSLRRPMVRPAMRSIVRRRRVRASSPRGV